MNTPDSFSSRFSTPLLALVFLFGAVGSGCSWDEASTASAAETPRAHAASAAPSDSTWNAFIDAETLHGWKTSDSSLVVVDARSSGAYETGHIPGAINVPGAQWRTPSRKPGEGPSKYIFRTADGSPDVARYERFLEKVGIDDSSRVVVYGDHGGSKTGTLPVMLLRWLGHDRAHFLDGVGLKQWKRAGYAVSTQLRTLSPATYEARPDANFLWTTDDVRAALDRENVVIVDTRSKDEYTGANPRSNRRSGHIPGAVRVNYSDLMHWPDRTTLPPSEAQQVLREKGLTSKADITYVLHCQTATRVSENYLVMKDLGYESVAVYDASWHDWGNRDDTPIVQGTASRATTGDAQR